MREVIQPPLLSTIARRATLLREILDGHTTKRELEAVLDVSRSTLDRAIRCLDKKELIAYRKGECVVTLYGRLALQEYERLEDQYDSLDSAKPLLLSLDPELSFPPAALRGADIVVAEQPAPHAPIDRLEDLLRECHSIVGFAPAVRPRSIEIFQEYITSGGVETELLLGGDLLDYLQTAHSSAFGDVLDCNHCTIRRVEEAPAFGIVLVDEDRVWIGVYDDRGRLQGAIVNHNAAALAWATDTIRTYPAQSEELSVQNRITTDA
jgi:predicted transcriptional regulator